MSDENSKSYTAEEAAVLVLKKAEEMIAKSNLAKANTAHEIEAGEEPSNDDAECPAYLAEADIESGSSTGKHGEGQSSGESADFGGESEGEESEDGEKKKKKTEGEESEGEESEAKEAVASQEKDEADADSTEDKEESGDSEKKENPFAKAEKLNKFMKMREDKVSGDASKKKELKNKKVEKFLGFGDDKPKAPAPKWGTSASQRPTVRGATAEQSRGTGDMKTNVGKLFGNLTGNNGPKKPSNGGY